MIHPQNHDPLVTVCIPSYNHSHFIAETIQSVIGQTYENIELIIIDDGSKDHSVEVIETFREAFERRFTRFEIRSRPNKGLSATLNEGIEWANGQYISVIASDDIAPANRICDLIRHIHNNENIAAVFGQKQVINSSGRLLNVTPLREGNWGYLNILKGEISLPAPAGCIRTDVLRRVGGFVQFGVIEDWPTFLNLTKDTGLMIRTIPKVVLLYRRHNDNTTRQTARMLESKLAIIEKYAEGEVADKARSRAYAAAASEAAFNGTWEALQYLARAPRIPLSQKVKIALAAMTPKLLLRYIYKFFIGKIP